MMFKYLPKIGEWWITGFSETGEVKGLELLWVNFNVLEGKLWDFEDLEPYRGLWGRRTDVPFKMRGLP